jgi:hypothetical protein
MNFLDPFIPFGRTALPGWFGLYGKSNTQTLSGIKSFFLTSTHIVMTGVDGNLVLRVDKTTGTMNTQKSWTPTSGSVDTHFVLETSAGNLIVGGQYSTAGGDPCPFVSKWDGTYVTPAWGAYIGKPSWSSGSTSGFGTAALLSNNDIIAMSSFDIPSNNGFIGGGIICKFTESTGALAAKQSIQVASQSGGTPQLGNFSIGGMVVDGSDNIYVVVYTNSGKVRLLKFNSTLSLQWQRNLTMAGVNSLILAPNGNLLIGGKTSTTSLATIVECAPATGLIVSQRKFLDGSVQGEGVTLVRSGSYIYVGIQMNTSPFMRYLKVDPSDWSIIWGGELTLPAKSGSFTPIGVDSTYLYAAWLGTHATYGFGQADIGICMFDLAGPPNASVFSANMMFGTTLTSTSSTDVTEAAGDLTIGSTTITKSTVTPTSAASANWSSNIGAL